MALSDGKEVSAIRGRSHRSLLPPPGRAEVGSVERGGVFYGAATTEARALEGQDVHVVGGANSTGQAAVHLSKYASKVTLLVRDDSLETRMSDYLIKEIRDAENIRVRPNTRVTGGGGEGRLERLALLDSASGFTETVEAAALFVLIGAEPRTGWLPGQIERDENGFVLTRGHRVGVAIQGKLDAGAPGDYVRSPVGVAVEAERLH